MKKIGTYLVYGLSFLLLMGAFALGTISFTDLGFQLVFVPGYLFTFGSMYLIFILHELGHAFCGYLTGYRLVALGLGSFLLTKKAGKFRLSRTAVLKNVGAQYIGLKEDESDQRMILMLSGGILVHLTLLIVSILFGVLTQSWYFAGTWICLNISFILANTLPLGITAQTLLAPEDYDLKDFVRPVPEEAQGGFVEGVLALQGEVLILEGNREAAKEQFQSLLERADNPMIQTAVQLSLLHIALLEGDDEKAEEFATIRRVKSFLSMKLTNIQAVQAWYQFKVKKDLAQTHKAIKLARQKMDVSRMLRDEKAYYQQWLDELEQAIQEYETQVS